MPEQMPDKNPWGDFEPVSRRDRGDGGPLAQVLVFAFFVLVGCGAGALFGYLMPLMGGVTREQRWERRSQTKSELDIGAKWRVSVGGAVGAALTAVGLVRILRK